MMTELGKACNLLQILLRPFETAGFPLLCPSESRPVPLKFWQEISAVENGIKR